MARFAVFLATLLAHPLAAQELIILPQPGSPGSPVILPAGLTNAAAPGEAAAPSPEELRLQELIKLNFDRSARSVLQGLARQLDAAAPSTNEVQQFQADVVAGRWNDVGRFIGGLPEKQRVQVYKHLLTQLQRAGPSQGPMPGMPMPEGEMPPGMQMQFPGGMPPGMQIAPILLPEDVLALADIAPVDLNDELTQSLGRLLVRALSRGNAIDPLLARLEAGTAKLGGKDPARRDLAARFLIAANRLPDAGKFLPSLDDAVAKGDLKALDLHARFLAAQGMQRDRTNAAADLRRAWDLTQSILAATNAASRDREQALTRALDLLPSLSRELGTNWLKESFARQPALGMNILAAVGGLVQQNLMNRDIDARLRPLELQRRAVEALLEVQSQPADAWRTAVNVLAMGWIQEADQSRQRWQPPRSQYQQFDPYGNPIYMDGEYYNPGMNNPNQIPALPPDKLALQAPGPRWLAVLDASLVPRVKALQAGLHLKFEQEMEALPFIEQLAVDQPKMASELANEALRVWGRNHNPNQRGNSYSPRYYSPYGMQTPQGISLTRAHQVRNLQELTTLLERLRRLPGVKLDPASLVAAFTQAHSNAEVFRVEDIEGVFGTLAALPPETGAELFQAMRQRLAGQWRQPRVQQDAKTRRTDKEIEAEVMRGYELVTQLIGKAIEQRADDWRLHAAQGAALFDWAEFDYGRKVDLAIYTAKRDQAFSAFRTAASQYASSLPKLPESEQSCAVYQQWFNSLLGASDLAYLTRQQEPATNHLDEIRAALTSLPGPVAERHLDLFGKALSEAANQIRPELKPRYLRSGLRIAGAHPSAEEVRRLVRYYDDLLGEITLEVQVDGDPVVGHGEPFGVFVSIRHSTAVARESGGFAKYLQNQGNQGYYYNPYGGGPVNYRDNFEKQVREKLGETFEILATAFHDDKVEARGVAGRPHWRETPYAYLLLKAKDAATDRLPALQLDMDFVDTRGQVVLPITSQVQWIDARPERPPRRPLAQVELTQTLDDRPARQGHLTLEIKAAGRGLVPELKELLDLAVPGFTIDTFTEPALVLSKVDAEGASVAALSERTALLTLRPDARGAVPATFQFPKPRSTAARTTFKRYADADVVEVKSDVALAGLALRSAPWWRWPLLGVFLASFGAAIWIWRTRHPAPAAESADRYALPSDITPFTVLALLRRIDGDRSVALAEDRRTALSGAIRELERTHFSRAGGSAPVNLEALARDWLQAIQR